MKIEDVTGGKVKIGNTVYNMVEAKFGGVVVWPLNATVTYQVVSGTPYFVFYNEYEQMVYSADKLRADGSLHAKMFGDVRVLENGVVKQTLPSVELHLTLPSSSPFSIYDNSVYGNNLGTTETSQQSSSVYVSYETSFPINGGTLYQEANVRTVVSTDYGSWQTVSDTPTGNPYDYHVAIGATQYTLATSADVCSAAGGSTQLYFPSGTCYHLQAFNRTRTRTVTENCTYTATGSTIHAEPQQPQTETVPWIATIEDTPAVTIVSGDTTAFHLNTSTLAVTIDSRGRVTGSQRSMTFRATNSNVTADVIIYQAANTASTTYVYSLEISIYGTGNLSYLAGNYAVSGHSKATPTTTYDSGIVDEGYPQSVISNISTTNCTANDGNGNTITTVSGDFGFFIQTTDNYSGQTRNIVVAIAPDGVTPVSDSRTQDYYSVPTINATLTPYVPSTTVPGMFELGKVYYFLSVTQGSLSSTTLSGVTFNYAVTNGQGSLQSSVNVGTMQVSPTSNPVLVVPSTSQNMPVFQSGDYVTAYFQVTNSGDITTLTCEIFSGYI